MIQLMTKKQVIRCNDLNRNGWTFVDLEKWYKSKGLHIGRKTISKSLKEYRDFGDKAFEEIKVDRVQEILSLPWSGHSSGEFNNCSKMVLLDDKSISKQYG